MSYVIKSGGAVTSNQRSENITSIEAAFGQYRDDTVLWKSSGGENGLKYWQNGKKKETKMYDIHIFPWKAVEFSEEDRATVMGLEESNEHNHFLMQLFRIPVNERCTVRKVMQLALNVGQLLGSEGSDELKAYVNKYKLDKLSTYLTKETMREMSAVI